MSNYFPCRLTELAVIQAVHLELHCGIEKISLMLHDQGHYLRALVLASTNITQVLYSLTVAEVFIGYHILICGEWRVTHIETLTKVVFI